MLNEIQNRWPETVGSQIVGSQTAGCFLFWLVCLLLRACCLWVVCLCCIVVPYMPSACFVVCLLLAFCLLCVHFLLACCLFVICCVVGLLSRYFVFVPCLVFACVLRLAVCLLVACLLCGCFMLLVCAFVVRFVTCLFFWRFALLFIVFGWFFLVSVCVLCCLLFVCNTFQAVFDIYLDVAWRYMVRQRTNK